MSDVLAEISRGITEPAQAHRGFAIVERELASFPRIMERLTSAGLQVVRVPFDRIPETISRIAISRPVVVAIRQTGRNGVAAQVELDARVSMIRQANSTVGLVVVRDTPSQLMPIRSVRLGRNEDASELEVLIKSLESNAEEMFEAARGPMGQEIGGSTRKSRVSSLPLTPNVNVKLPGMLLGIARVAARRKAPILCEISPQEALIYYSGPGGKVGSAMDTVKRALGRVRADVDQVCKVSGAELFLHLDHAHDLELIAAALDCGFDSVMADGSNRTLEANIRLVRATADRAKSYGVPVEAEVGDLDSQVARRFSHTQAQDVESFLQEVRPDFLAVCVGQDHSSDYGFERARRSLALLQDLDREYAHSGRRCFYESCREFDDRLAELGLSRESHLRRLIHEAQRRLVEEAIPLEQVVRDMEAQASVSDALRLAEMRVRSTELRLDVEQRRSHLVRSMLGVDEKVVVASDHKRNLNRELLIEIAKVTALHGTSLVLHGGSSIAARDLHSLPSVVKRVNFGSSVFLGFAKAILPHSDWVDSLEKMNRFDLFALVDQAARDWERWVDRPPAFLDAFEAFLESEILEPFEHSRFGYARPDC